MPLTIPDVAPIVATAVLSLLHDTPPAVGLLYTVVEPSHIDEAPVIALGNGFTVIEVALKQPVGIV